MRRVRAKPKAQLFQLNCRLPKLRKRKEAASVESVSPTPVPAKHISGKGIHILLVEDHEPTRAGLTHLLLRRNYKVTSAGSLSEARELLQRGSFNILISDIGLPDGNGCDLMEESRDRWHVKGIALTGYGMEEDVNRSYSAGFSAHLTKPIRIESLDDALTIAMGGGKMNKRI